MEFVDISPDRSRRTTENFGQILDRCKLAFGQEIKNYCPAISLVHFLLSLSLKQRLCLGFLFGVGRFPATRRACAVK
jgi:hypothetical protein